MMNFVFVLHWYYPVVMRGDIPVILAKKTKH